MQSIIIIINKGYEFQHHNNSHEYILVLIGWLATFGQCKKFALSCYWNFHALMKIIFMLKNIAIIENYNCSNIIALNLNFLKILLCFIKYICMYLTSTFPYDNSNLLLYKYLTKFLKYFVLLSRKCYQIRTNYTDYKYLILSVNCNHSSSLLFSLLRTFYNW